jgi:hypothetical protein
VGQVDRRGAIFSVAWPPSYGAWERPDSRSKPAQIVGTDNTTNVSLGTLLLAAALVTALLG